MPQMHLVIAFGAITIASLLYVFWLTPETQVVKTPLERELEFLAERKEMVYEGLRDLQMEYGMGKLSDGDYQELKLSFQHQLAALLDEAGKLGSGPAHEPETTAPAPGRCPSCGTGNPPANTFCGNCGTKLAGPGASA